MRIIKLAGLSFVFLFLLITAFSLFIPSTVRISKAINLETNRESVLPEVSDLNNWRNWHPSLKGIANKNFILLDDGYIKVGNDLMKIIGSGKDEVVTEIKNTGGRPVISKIKLISYPDVDSLTIQWYMEFKLRWYPWEKFRSLIYENIYGTQMEEGLSNLKQLFTDRRPSLR